MTDGLVDETPRPLLETTARSLQRRLASAQVAGRAPSMAAAVVRNGSTVWVGSHGFVGDEPPSGDTQYRIGSITKTFVAVLVMRLRDEGLVDLSDRLDAHLPETASLPGIGTARISELLAHTAGLASETPPPWWERSDGAVRPAVADLLGEHGVKHGAGRAFHYSNPGFGLLGALVTEKRGMPWLDVAGAEILEPLGMTRTTPMPVAPAAEGWAVHPWADLLMPEPAHDAGLMAPAGQLWSSACDLARFASFLAEGSPAVLSRRALAEMRRPSSPPSSTADGPSWESGYGLGMQLLRHDGRFLSGHTGSMPGFVATLWTSPADGLAAVAFANATSGPAISTIVAELIGIVATQEPSIPAPWRPATNVDPQMLANAGVWFWGANPMALRVRADGDFELGPLGGTGRGSRFTPAGDGTWLGLDGYYFGETLRAIRDEDGMVSHLDIGSFVFTRQPYEAGRAGDPVPGGVDGAGWRPR